MTSITEFLYQIADELGKPHDSMKPIIEAFESNWYDTTDSIRNLDDSSFEKLKIPARLIDKIKEKLQVPQQTQPQIIKNTNPNTLKLDSKTNLNQKKINNEGQIPMEIESTDKNQGKIDYSEWLDQLKRDTITGENFFSSLDLLTKITENIVKEPKNEQYRTLKLTNLKLKEKLLQYNSAIDLLFKIGFTLQNDEMLILTPERLNLGLIKELNLQLQSYKVKAQQVSFDPYKSSFTGVQVEMSVPEFVQKAGGEITSFAEKLDSLKRQRDELIKPKIENKDPRIYKMNAQQSISQFISGLDTSAFEEEDTKSDAYLFREQTIKWAKQIEESQQFTSRRKKEFEDLIKKPLFTETKIRVRFPDLSILELRFSPKETLKNVVDYVHGLLKDPNESFYLYQSPPIQKVTKYQWNKTLDEAECVPSALFYFALDDKEKETPERAYLKQ